jgi:hypothetical protein
MVGISTPNNWSLRRVAASTPEQAARICADKMLIYLALLNAVSRVPASVQPGVRICEQYGAAAAELAGRPEARSAGRCPPRQAVSRGSTTPRDDLRAHPGRFATDHAKVLVRENPDQEAGQRAVGRPIGERIGPGRRPTAGR